MKRTYSLDMLWHEKEIGNHEASGIIHRLTCESAMFKNRDLSFIR